MISNSGTKAHINEDEEYIGHKGPFKLSQLPQHDPALFARHFMSLRYSVEYRKNHTIQPRRPSKRQSMSADNLHELK